MNQQPEILPDKILADNLLEAFRQLQRYLVLGLGSALFYLLLARANAAPSESAAMVALPSGLLATDPRFASTLAITLYWGAGAFATWIVSRADRIVKELKRRQPSALEALLTYPTLGTYRIHGPRLGAVLLPPILVVSAGFLYSQWKMSSQSVALTAFLIIPYLVLTVQLRVAIGGQQPDSHGD